MDWELKFKNKFKYCISNVKIRLCFENSICELFFQKQKKTTINFIGIVTNTVLQETQCEMRTLGQKLAKIYSDLSRDAFSKGSKLWKMNPKLHLFEHLTQHQISFGNPRFFWCYSDEDLIGLVTEISKTVHPRTLPVSTLFKWLHCMFDGRN